MEKIKPIEGFPNYFITNTGKVYTEYRGTKRKELKLHKHHSGYNYANIYRKNDDGITKRHYIRVHRLVYKHFIGELDPNLVVDHKDECKTNNHWNNLQQITLQENLQKYWKKRRENERKQK